MGNENENLKLVGLISIFQNWRTNENKINVIINDVSINDIINIVDKKGYTLLTYAIKYNCPENIVKSLKAKITPEQKMQYKNKNKGKTQLMYAVINKDDCLVQKFVNLEDVEINMRDDNGFTSLMYATMPSAGSRYVNGNGKEVFKDRKKKTKEVLSDVVACNIIRCLIDAGANYIDKVMYLVNPLSMGNLGHAATLGVYKDQSCEAAKLISFSKYSNSVSSIGIHSSERAVLNILTLEKEDLEHFISGGYDNGIHDLLSEESTIIAGLSDDYGYENRDPIEEKLNYINRSAVEILRKWFPQEQEYKEVLKRHQEKHRLHKELSAYTKRYEFKDNLMLNKIENAILGCAMERYMQYIHTKCNKGEYKYNIVNKNCANIAAKLINQVVSLKRNNLGPGVRRSKPIGLFNFLQQLCDRHYTPVFDQSRKERHPNASADIYDINSYTTSEDNDQKQGLSKEVVVQTVAEKLLETPIEKELTEKLQLLEIEDHNAKDIRKIEKRAKLGCCIS